MSYSPPAEIRKQIDSRTADIRGQLAAKNIEVADIRSKAAALAIELLGKLADAKATADALRVEVDEIKEKGP